MENNNIVQDLIFNFLLDNTKKNLEKRDRAKLLAKYMEDSGISQRELGRQLNVPSSTIQDWLMFNNISDKEYVQYKKDGILDTTIYRALRKHKGTKLKDFDMGVIKADLKLSIFKYKKIIKHGKHFDTECQSQIEELINVLNRGLMRSQYKFKGG